VFVPCIRFDNEEVHVNSLNVLDCVGCMPVYVMSVHESFDDKKSQKIFFLIDEFTQ